MKIKFLLLTSLMLFSLAMTNVSTAEHMQEFPTMDCAYPTESYVIGSIAGELKFNVTELKIPKGICFSLTFANPDKDAHDLTVLDEDGEEWIHMDVSTGGILDGKPDDGVGTHYYESPDFDITRAAFCEVEGHRDAGMEFTITIGEGGEASAPGFELPLIIVGLLSMLAIAPRLRRN